MDELRRSAHEKTYKAGRIGFGGRRAVITCLIRDLSESGACLGLDDPAEVPDAFNLVFETGERSRSCEVIWRRGKRIGVKFC
jgi:hypothetical protein